MLQSKLWQYDQRTLSKVKRNSMLLAIRIFYVLVMMSAKLKYQNLCVMELDPLYEAAESYCREHVKPGVHLIVTIAAIAEKNVSAIAEIKWTTTVDDRRFYSSDRNDRKDHMDTHQRSSYFLRCTAVQVHFMLILISRQKI